jgi:Dioxygenase
MSGQTDGEGLYEAQREVEGTWMRGIYRSQRDGSYAIRTVVPTGYTIPMDGTGGELLSRTDIEPVRPADIHFRLVAPGYHPVVTHLFDRASPCIDKDVVYGVTNLCSSISCGGRRGKHRTASLGSRSVTISSCGGYGNCRCRFLEPIPATGDQQGRAPDRQPSRNGAARHATGRSLFYSGLSKKKPPLKVPSRA